MRAISCSKAGPDSNSTSPLRDTMEKPREPPFQSPSLAITSRFSSSHLIASGSRATPCIAPVKISAPSFLVSMPSRSTDPAEKCDSAAPSRDRITMWLFSCIVSAISPFALMSTNSGSGSSAPTAARPLTSALTIAAQSGAPSLSGTIITWPPGNCGRAPSLRSSSRSFSIATARNEPSLARATESG